MKKIFLLAILSFHLTFVFGQERDEVGHRVTPWVIARHGCFNGLEWKVRKSYYSDNSNNFINEIEIKNKYSSNITFSFDLSSDANVKTTQSRKTLNPGETMRFKKVQNVDFVYLYIADVCFNSDNRCSGTCYALCDNGTPNIPKDCGGQKSISNNNSESQINNSNQQNLKEKEDVEKQKKIAVSEEKAQKEAEEKKAQFDKYINAGDNDMSANKYSSAMNNYQQALNYATDASQKNTAQQKYNQAKLAQEGINRKDRTDKVKEKDKNENIAAASATAGMIGLMALVNDEVSENLISGRLQLGLGLDNIPLITNSVSPSPSRKSYIQSSLHPTFYFGFKIGINETKTIFGNINPFFTAGLNALDKGTTGGHITYGSLANINFKLNKKSIFGCYIEGGMIWKSGRLDFDYDASTDNTTQTDDVRLGEYSYRTIRYGGGLMLHRAKYDYYWFLKLGINWDRADFMGTDNSSILNLSLQFLDSDLGKIEFIYSPNSYVGGDALYPTTLSRENKDYFMIRFVRQGKLW